MNLQEYIDQHGLHRRPIGEVLFAAVESERIDGITLEREDVIEVLEGIGISEKDRDQAMLIQKIRFALRASDERIANKHASTRNITEVTVGELSDLVEAGIFREKGDPIDLQEVRTEKGFREARGENTKGINWDEKTALSIRKYVEMKEGEEVKEIRDHLAILLAWMDVELQESPKPRRWDYDDEEGDEEADEE